MWPDLLPPTRSSPQTAHQSPAHISPRRSSAHRAGAAHRWQRRPTVAASSGPRPLLPLREAPCTGIRALCVRSSLPPNRVSEKGCFQRLLPLDRPQNAPPLQAQKFSAAPLPAVVIPSAESDLLFQLGGRSFSSDISPPEPVHPSAAIPQSANPSAGLSS